MIMVIELKKDARQKEATQPTAEISFFVVAFFLLPPFDFFTFFSRNGILEYFSALRPHVIVLVVDR